MTSPEPASALGVLAGLLALGGLGGTARTMRRQNLGFVPAPVADEDRASKTQATDVEPVQRPHVAMVINPTKVKSVRAEARWLTELSRRSEFGDPQIFETTITDPGAGQARQAQADGAATVIAYGGDGTVRCVAGSLAGSDVPLSILPAGTGNLLARNLSLPLTDLDAAARVALAGSARRVDIGRAEMDSSGEDHDPRHEAFCVMAGIGFDAEIMAGVEPKMKRRIGWAAYIVEGVRRVNGRRVRVTIKLDDDDPIHRRVRSVVVGNCGALVGGIPLIPGAELDDGELDVMVASPSGIFGWGALVALVLTRRRKGHPVVQHFRCRKVEIRTERPIQAQVDGDDAGKVRAFRASVDPGALLVRVPKS